ncbi:MAG: hypothetical protein U0794_06825 [Isosphaeraceae bacterium]
MRKLIKDVALSAGWEIAGEAKNGEEAVSLYRSLRPDLVTMDLVMPIMEATRPCGTARRIRGPGRGGGHARPEVDAHGIDSRRGHGLHCQTFDRDRIAATC